MIPEFYPYPTEDVGVIRNKLEHDKRIRETAKEELLY